MITITVLRDKSGNYTGFHTFGHAEFADSGEDIICAAVSMLVINTINSMEVLLQEPFECNSEDENGFIHFRFKELPGKDAVLLMDSMILGLQEVQKQYGKKYILLKFEEV
ncbi:MAG: ribosomal-processing cysteine protease Prp [Lachnospiraceae bacterium]|nr:ribosomal-processing cysteine protease Prp [Lachnospiraceae bacterium]